jgi:DNA-binding transcriptional regulator YhcF (GntR family)
VTRPLRARLEAGECSPGERLPSVAAFAAELAVGHGTARSGGRWGRLRDEGLIVTLPRYRTFRSRQGHAAKD